MRTPRPLIAFTVVCVLAGTSSRAFAQGGTAAMDHSKHRMGPEIVVPKGARYTKADVEVYRGVELRKGDVLYDSGRILQRVLLGSIVLSDGCFLFLCQFCHCNKLFW